MSKVVYTSTLPHCDRVRELPSHRHCRCRASADRAGVLGVRLLANRPARGRQGDREHGAVRGILGRRARAPAGTGAVARIARNAKESPDRGHGRG